jgi:hypothetical protein
MLHSSPSSLVPASACILNNSGARSIRLSLSPCPDPWSAHLESASGLPMLQPGLW